MSKQAHEGKKRAEKKHDKSRRGRCAKGAAAMDATPHDEITRAALRRIASGTAA